jgi:hypothetical protein
MSILHNIQETKRSFKRSFIYSYLKESTGLAMAAFSV